MAKVKNLEGTTVYEVGEFGQYAGEKRGSACCWKKTITDSFDSAYGGKMVGGGGGTRRLVLNGVKSSYCANRTADGWTLPLSLSLTPVGEELGI